MQLAWQSSPKTVPNSISEMALPKRLNEILLKIEKKKDFPHIIMNGTFGSGKTTSARILARLVDDDFIEHDCNENGEKKDFIELTKKLKTTSLFALASSKADKRVVILDEFDNASVSAQNVFKKFMEKFEWKVKVIICTNYIEKVSPAISDRCMYMDFNVAVIDEDKRTGKQKLLIHPDTGYKNQDEWIKELEKSVDVIAKKLDIKLTKKMKEQVANNPHNLQSVRSYVRSMQLAYEDIL